jgi:hypothetical protein
MIADKTGSGHLSTGKRKCGKKTNTYLVCRRNYVRKVVGQKYKKILKVLTKYIF